MQTDKAQTLHRIIAILDCFTLEHPAMGVREVARVVHLSSSTTGRLMASLKRLRILSQNPSTHTYSLGARVLTWAGVYTGTLDIRNTALPALEELHRDTRETISLYILEGNERVCVERIESPENVRIVARLGRRLPLYAGSAGKVFLAFMPSQEREEILNSVPLVPLTTHTITDPAELHKELDCIRQQGYAISRGEWTQDASGVAAPVFDPTGIVAALTISGPSQRFTAEAFAKYVPEVSRVAATISRDLGYRGNGIGIQPVRQSLH
ncbi:MAG TPA: IclR family transcriptional regulator [Anaerolineaceae bacterium]|jgi:IclR family transcriptional regulator, KDG regulon repressor